MNQDSSSITSSNLYPVLFTDLDVATATTENLEAEIHRVGDHYAALVDMQDVVDPDTAAGRSLGRSIYSQGGELLSLINAARALKGLTPRTRLG